MGELISAILEILFGLITRRTDISKFKEPSTEALNFCNSFYSNHNIEKLSEDEIISLLKTNLTSFKNKDVKLSDMFVLIYLKKIFGVSHLKKFDKAEQKEFTKRWIEFKKQIPNYK
jgi:hypothetical protein